MWGVAEGQGDTARHAAEPEAWDCDSGGCGKGLTGRGARQGDIAVGVQPPRVVSGGGG